MDFGLPVFDAVGCMCLGWLFGVIVGLSLCGRVVFGISEFCAWYSVVSCFVGWLVMFLGLVFGFCFGLGLRFCSLCLGVLLFCFSVGVLVRCDYGSWLGSGVVFVCIVAVG